MRFFVLKVIGFYIVVLAAISLGAAILTGIGLLLAEPAKKFYEWIFSRVHPNTKEWIEEKFIGIFLTLWLFLILYFMAG